MPNEGIIPSSDMALDPALLPFTKSIAESKKSVIAFKYIAHLLRGYEAGTKLPSEREIAELLGMTRSPVHEALVALRMAGRVRIEPGVGAYSVGSEGEMENGPALNLLAESESPHEVLQLRSVVEEVILRTLIPEITAEKLELLEAAFQRLAHSMSKGGLKEYIDANREFHMALATATDNSLLARLEHWILYQMMAQKLWSEVLKVRISEMADDAEAAVEGLVEEHHKILTAIRAHDTEGAISLMLRHVGRIEAEAQEKANQP